MTILLAKLYKHEYVISTDINNWIQFYYQLSAGMNSVINSMENNLIIYISYLPWWKSEAYNDIIYRVIKLDIFHINCDR